MDWIEHGLVALAIGLPAMLGLMVLVTASRLARLKLRRSSLSVVTEGDIPQPVRLTLDKAKPLLESLGFEFRYTTASERAIATDGDSLLYTDVYEHSDGQSHALATPSMTPEHGEPCTLMWVTLLEGRRAIATVNCYSHTMVSVPAGWTLYDDYVPDLREAWERHRKRIAGVKEAIVQDGVEFFNAMKVSTDGLMAHGERQGVVVREGDHWRMPWRVAIRFAWKLFLGQRKVAKARTAGPGKPSSAVGVEADVEAFQHQQAMLRTTRWSSGKKWKVFLLTAALFLGVGSLWISVTFLPILLVVIGLHEGGHYLAMKISGYRNLSVFFVPGLGGLAMGEKASASPWEKLFVYLAGPMPGIALAVAGLIGQALGAFQPPGWFQEFLIACLIINYLNLLPITPLDGGRVVETFLFARLPVARFLFAALGVGAFAAVGFSTGDKVMLVLAVLVGLSLPHQWRVMRVDRAITRHGSEALDERTAIERVFTALQHPKFAGWPFATRSAAVTALLPELQGRRAGVLEAAGGMAIYAACLFGPPLVAVLSVPQLAALGAAVTDAYKEIPDDVVDDPAARQRRHEPGRNWYAEAARVESLPEPQRLPVLLGAAELSIEVRDEEKSAGFIKAAWDIAEKRPAGDYERARTVMSMSRHTQDAGQRRQWLMQVAEEMEAVADKRSRLLAADARERLSWESETPAAERGALMRQVLAHRQEAMPAGAPELVATRLSLAQVLDAQDNSAEAEALLRQNVQSIPVPAPDDRSRESLQRRIERVTAQVELAWFLTSHARPQEASQLMDAAAAGIPARVSVSWEHPNRQAREAQLWARLQYADAGAVKESWHRYEQSRTSVARGYTPSVLHEIDRFVVAQSTADAAFKMQAVEAIVQNMKKPQAKYVKARFCEQQDLPRRWRSKQQQARAEAAKAGGVCASA